MQAAVCKIRQLRRENAGRLTRAFGICASFAVQFLWDGDSFCYCGRGKNLRFGVESRSAGFVIDLSVLACCRSGTRRMYVKCGDDI